MNFVCGDSKVCEMAHFNGAGDLYDDSTGTVPFSVLKRHPSATKQTLHFAHTSVSQTLPLFIVPVSDLLGVVAASGQ